MEIRILEKLDNILRILQNKIPNDKYMDMGQVADFSSMSRSSIRRSCADGRLKYSDKHGKYLFLRSEVLRWIKNG